MTTENTFETMGANALSNVDETLEDIKENQERENPYKLTQALLDEGFIFDNTGVYIPFKAKFQSIGIDDFSNFETSDNIYLWASRNPDKKLEIHCKWAKKTPEGFQKSRGFNIFYTSNFTVFCLQRQTVFLQNFALCSLRCQLKKPSSCENGFLCYFTLR